MQDAIVRGILTGGALGLIGTWFLDMDPMRAVGLGLIAGFLAGYTSYRMRRKRNGDR
jgi:hypothetical protein